MEEKCIQFLVLKPGNKRAIGRPRRRWENNIKIHIREMEGLVLSRCLWLRIGTLEPVANSRKHNNEPLWFHKILLNLE
jgi:hypothetical protein